MPVCKTEEGKKIYDEIQVGEVSIMYCLAVGIQGVRVNQIKGYSQIFQNENIIMGQPEIFSVPF